MNAVAAVGPAPTRFGNLRHTALSAFWFGNFFLWQPLTTVVIQNQIDDVVRTTSSIWFWITTVVSGCHKKKLPNQNALRAVWRRLPKRVGAGPTAATAFIC